VTAFLGGIVKKYLENDFGGREELIRAGVKLLILDHVSRFPPVPPFLSIYPPF
jgi:hypothetical protein